MSEKKILIVDDEPFIVRSLSFVLKKMKHKIVSAGNGEEAIQKAKEIRPDLMFLDVMMPKKDGFAVVEEIKKDPELKDIYVVMLTAKGRDEDRQRGLDLGANEFLTKPFNPPEVLKTVKKVLGDAA
jgi:CheY-like chemotaxis protein